MTVSETDAPPYANAPTQWTCVQCNGDIVDAANVDGACRFHTASAWGQKRECCGQSSYSEGCQRAWHRPAHHNDYPYEAKTNWSSAIRNYTDKGKDLLVVKVSDNRKANKEIQASVGAVQQNHPEKGKIFITTYIDDNRWFMTYSKADVAALDSGLAIFDIKGKEGENAFAKWLVNGDGTVGGVQVAVATPTVKIPAVSQVWLTFPAEGDTVLTEYDIKTISQPSFGEVAFSGSYTFPAVQTTGPIKPLPAIRVAEEPVQWTSGDLGLKFKVRHTEVAHQCAAGTPSDFYKTTLTLVNTTDKDITILQTASFYCHHSDAEGCIREWTPTNWHGIRADSDYSSEHDSPITVEARSAYNIRMTARVNNVPEKSHTFQRVGSLTFLAPILIDWEFEDLEGNKGGLVVEYPVSKDPGYATVPEEAIYTHFLQEESLDRHYCWVKPADGEDEVLKIRAPSSELTLTVNMLRHAVWSALEIGTDVYNLWSHDAYGIHWGVTGLVDRKRRAVYGLKIHTTKESVGVIGWCEVPLYGDAKILGAKVVEAIDSVEGIAIPEGYQVLEVPKRTDQPKAPFELRIKPTQPGITNSIGVPMNGDLEATIKAIVERQVNEKLVEVLEKLVADLKASLRS